MRKKESTLSRKPPCPGIEFPESFTPYTRLINDSAMSLYIATIERTKPSASRVIAFPGNPKKCPQKKVKIRDATTCPIPPSIVFPGLTNGASFLLPKFLPVKYAAVSPIQIKTIRKKR